MTGLTGISTSLILSIDLPMKDNLEYKWIKMGVAALT